MRTRSFLFVVAALNVLFIGWTVLALVESATPRKACDGIPSTRLCEKLVGMGSGLDLVWIIAIWLTVDLILLGYWLFQRAAKRREVEGPAAERPAPQNAAARAEAATYAAEQYAQQQYEQQQYLDQQSGAVAVATRPPVVAAVTPASRSRQLIRRIVVVTAVLVVTVGGTTAGILIGRDQGYQQACSELLLTAPTCN